MMSEHDHSILLVDDEPDILSFVGYNLEREGYKVFTAADGLTAIKLARRHQPHLIILDVMMPGMDGMETCQEIKKLPGLSRSIIAFLTARGEDYSQIAGFDAGGDDYITKPIKPKLLISRVKALLRRYQFTGEAEAIAPDYGLRIDREQYVAWNNQQKIELPPKEFELLCLLVSKPKKVFSREEIFANVWGSDVIVSDRTIDVHIRKLREKVGSEYIGTVKGVGYKYVPHD